MSYRFLKNAPSSCPSWRHAVLMAASLAMLMTSFEVRAAPVSRASPPVASAPVDATDFGARKRHRRGHGGHAAGLAMMGLMIGTVGSVIAAQRQQEAYDAAYNRRYYGGYAPHPHYRHAPHSYGHAPQWRGDPLHKPAPPAPPQLPAVQ